MNNKLKNFLKSSKFIKNIYDKIKIDKKYKVWIQKNEPNKKQLKLQKKEKFMMNPKISIVVPLYNTKRKFFNELYLSLKKQTYSNWELCLADGSKEKIKYVEKYVKRDKRVKYMFIGENKGISGNTNEALKLATGEYIGLLDHDDLLAEFALYEIVKAINENPDVKFIYSDEDKLENMNGPRYGAFFKPDYSPYTLNSANYICHFSVFEKSIINKLKGFRSEYDGSQDFDIVARTTEITNNIIHIPKILYHWRAHRESTAQNSESKPYAFEVGKNVIRDHVKRSLGTSVEIKDGLTPGSYEIKYIPKKEYSVSIIIDMEKSDLKSIKRIIEIVEKSNYKNKEVIIISEYEDIMGNYKVVQPLKKLESTLNSIITQLKSEYFIILDKALLDVNQNDWIEQLLGIAQDSNVAMVGTKIINQQDEVEHCGLILGMNGIADFIYKNAPKDIGTYMQRLKIIHNVSAVYYKYAMINKNAFCHINKFDEDLTDLVMNIDLCLNFLKQKEQIVLNPLIEFKVQNLLNIKKNEKEIKKLTNKWEKDSFEDKYFSPNLSKYDIGLSLNI